MDTRNQSDSDALKTIINRKLVNVRTAIPGEITKINTGTNNSITSVEVVPGVQRIQTIDDQKTLITMPPVLTVPLVYPHAQTLGYAMTIPVSVGDEVLLIVADRSIDNWTENGGIQPPVESTVSRMHSITDSLAIVGATPMNRALSEYQTDRIEIRNSDRSTRVSLRDDEIEIRTSQGNITVNDSGITATVGDNTITMTTASTIIQNDGQSMTVSATGIDLNGTVRINGTIQTGN